MSRDEVECETPEDHTHKGEGAVARFGHKVESAEKSKLMGYVFILIALVMVLQGAWLQWSNQQEAECQADYNQDVSAVVSQRAVWADEDRTALNTMIFAVIDPKSTQAERTEAVQTFADTAKKNDENRQANPMPKRTDC